MNHLEGRRDAPVRLRVTLGVELGCAGQHRSAQRPDRPGQDIGLAHGAQVAHQGEGIGIAHSHPVHVADRQGETGPLQQTRPVETVGEGRNPRLRPAIDLQFGLGQHPAQFLQRRRAEQAGDEQAVGPQGAADLAERARQVVGPVQAQQVDDQVGGLIFQPQRPSPRCGALGNRAHGADLGHPLARRAVGHRLRKHARMGRQVDGGLKLAQDHLQTVHRILGGAQVQEVGVGETSGCAAQARGAAGGVEDDRGTGGGGAHVGSGWGLERSIKRRDGAYSIPHARCGARTAGYSAAAHGPRQPGSHRLGGPVARRLEPGGLPRSPRLRRLRRGL
ncbi:hypothetical protein D3C72_1148330 [compost metagenome]